MNSCAKRLKKAREKFNKMCGAIQTERKAHLKKTLRGRIIMKVEEGKTYQTMAGQRVEYIRIKMKNDAGDPVTFPVKGTIIRSEKPRRTEYTIWSLDGVVDPVWNRFHMDNLVEVQD